MIGIVNWFDQEKGWGFIRSSGFERSIFVHRKHVKFPASELVPDLHVHFDMEITAKGPQARSVRKA